MPKPLSFVVIFLITIIVIFFLPATCCAQVVLNEFNSDSPDDSPDWIEIYNTTSGSVDLTGWIIKDTAASPVHSFSENILPGGESCVESVGSRLNKDGDKIQLFNGSTEIDCVAYGDGNGSFCGTAADVGKPATGQTAYRDPQGTGSWVLGSPSQSATTCASLIPTPTPTPTPTLTPTPTPTSTPTSTPTPTKTPITTKTPTPTAKKTSTLKPEEMQVEETVLGLRNELVTQNPTPTSVASEQKRKFPYGAVILIVVGTLLVGGSGFVLFKKIRQDNITQGEQENNDGQID